MIDDKKANTLNAKLASLSTVLNNTVLLRIAANYFVAFFTPRPQMTLSLNTTAEMRTNARLPTFVISVEGDTCRFFRIMVLKKFSVI